MLSLFVLHTSKNGTITPEDFMRHWEIGIDNTRRTLKSNYQEYIRSTNNLTHYFKTARVHSRYRQLMGTYSKVYTEFLSFWVILIRGNVCGKVSFEKITLYVKRKMPTKRYFL